MKFILMLLTRFLNISTTAKYDDRICKTRESFIDNICLNDIVILQFKI